MVDPKALKIAPKPSRELPSGAVIDARYRVVRTLGTGGTAIVYEVEHVRTGRRLALKVVGDSGQAARLEQEAKATAKLRSRHAVRVVDLGVHAGSPYLVMSLLEGHSLRDLLVRRGKIDLAAAANIVLQVAECLDEAHQLGLVHRDLKPENFHLRPLGVRDDTSLFDVTVLDFGVVKMAYDDSTTQLTRTGSTVGTPFYMSLEQLRGAATVDAQSDVYSLSVLLYESFTGTVPFQAATLGDLVFAICSAPPIALGVVRPELPAAVSDVVMAGLSSSKADRPKSMRTVAEAFRAHADPAFSLWLRGESGGVDAASEPQTETLTRSPKTQAVAPAREARAPLSDPPTVLGGPALKVPAAPRPPGLPKPPPKPGDAPRSDPRGAAASPARAPNGNPTPAVGVGQLRVGAAPVSAGLRAPIGKALVPSAPLDPGIEEPSTSRDEDEPATAVAHDRDRDTPTEMFVKDVHGHGGPPGMPLPSDPPAPATEVDPAQYPTMNLDVPSVDTSESTAVLSLPLAGPAASNPGPAAPTLVSPREPNDETARLGSLSGVGPPSGVGAPSGVGSPTFGTPSHAFAAASNPAAQGLQGQGYPYAPYPASAPFHSQSIPTSAVASSGAPRSIDVFMQQLGRRGNELGARGLAKFRAASPGQQALIVGLAAALGAIIVVSFVFLIFF